MDIHTMNKINYCRNSTSKNIVIVSCMVVDPIDWDHVEPIDWDHVEPIDWDHVDPIDGELVDPIDLDHVEPIDEELVDPIDLDHVEPIDGELVDPIDLDPGIEREHGLGIAWDLFGSRMVELLVVGTVALT